MDDIVLRSYGTIELEKLGKHTSKPFLLVLFNTPAHKMRNVALLDCRSAVVSSLSHRTIACTYLCTNLCDYALMFEKIKDTVSSLM